MNNINEKLRELMELLKNQKEVVIFNKIEENMKNNELINEKLNDFRKVQQKYVLYENKNGTLPIDTQKRYDDLLDELLDIPLFNDYLNLQTEINDVIQQISSIIESEINAGLDQE